MFLRYSKTITKEQAEELRKVNEILVSLEKLKDTDYLCAALEPLKEAGNFSQKLTPIVQPEYEVLHIYKKPVYKKVSGSKKKHAYLDCGNGGKGKLVSFSLNTAGKRSIGFFIGQFWIGGDPIGKWLRSENCLLSTAQYFFNRFSTYKEIHYLLTKNKNELAKAVGELFADDMITLFSVDKISVSEQFDLSFNEVEPLILKRKAREKGSTFLGTIMFRPETYFCGSFYLAEIKNELWLTKNNQLILDVFPKYRGQKEALNRMKQVKEDKEFSLFLEKQIGKWLNALVTEADFSSKLLEVNKTNILMGNI